LIALQVPYNLTERTVERELLPMALEMGIGVLPWSPLAGGVLSGKYDSQDLNAAAPATPQLLSRKNINLSTGRLSARNLQIATTVKAIAEEMNRTPAQIALAWTLQHPAVISPIIGARTVQQLEDNLACLQVAFSAEQLARLDEASRIEMGFPHSMYNSRAMDSMFGYVQAFTKG
jgi:aryl-alcohol dehydrogenase-like predicted oxidoreductase